MVKKLLRRVPFPPKHRHSHSYMDLSLATPYLDHDALRDTLPSRSTTIEDKDLSPLLTEI